VEKVLSGGTMPAVPTIMNSVENLPESKLGTKEHWDQVYE